MHYQKHAIVFCLLLLCLVNCLAGCQHQSKSSLNIRPNSPATVDSLPSTSSWGAREIHLTRIIIGTTKKLHLELSPLAHATQLEVPYAVIPTCGCMHPKLTARNPNSLSTLGIDFVYVARGPKGVDEQSIRLLGQDGRLMGLIKITAMNLPPIDVDPAVHNFGTISEASNNFRKVVLKTNIDQKLPLKVFSSPPWLTTNRMSSLSGSEIWSVGPSINAVPGPLDGAVRWEVAGVKHPLLGSTLLVTGLLTGPVNASPHTLVFPLVKSGRRSTSSFQLSFNTPIMSRRTKLFAYSDRPEIKVALKNLPMSQQIAGLVSFVPNAATEAMLSGNIVVKNSSQVALLRIPYSALVVKGSNKDAN